MTPRRPSSLRISIISRIPPTNPKEARAEHTRLRMRIIQLGKKLDMREAELQERVFLQGKAQIAAQKTRMTMQEAQMAMDDAGRAFRELANKAPSKMKKVWRKWQEARMALRVHWEVQEAGWLVLETESIIRDIEFSISGVKLAIEWTLRAIRNGDGGKRNKI